jgi:hypothetical protein
MAFYILENKLASKQKTLAVLKDKLALYAMIIQKLEQHLRQKSNSVSNNLANTTKRTQKNQKNCHLIRLLWST